MNPATDRLAIRVLGPLEVLAGDRPLVVDTRKALAILAVLAVEGRPFARDELAALLWPEGDDESARGALRRTLSVLKAGLGERWLVVERSTVALDRVAVDLDLEVLETAARAGVERAREALNLARGPFLAGFSLRDSPDFDDWRATTAAAVERRVHAALDRLVETAEAAGRYDDAIAASSRRVEMDPLDEPARRRLMLLLGRTGARAAAIRTYRAGVAVLDRELGVAPLAETTELYEAIRDDRIPVELRVAAGAPPRAADDLPFVGRDAALRQVLEAHREASVAGRVVTVVGEAGIGKTRLADAVAQRVEALGGRVVGARAYPAESAIAYAPIAELLRGAIALPDAGGRLARLSRPGLSEVARLAPLPEGLAGGGAAPEASEDGARIRLLDGIASVLVAAVESEAVAGVLRIEDLQWADEASREAIAYIARRLRESRVLVLLTWRDEDLDDRGRAFVRMITGLPMVVSIDLRRLDRAAVQELVRAHAGEDAASVDQTTDALYEESEGLPLYVVEALAMGDDARSAAVGRTVRALLRERLAAASEVAGQVLLAAAVIGRSFEFATVRAASGRSEAETVDALDELVRRGIVREAGVADGAVRYDFAHAKLRDAAYEAASLARRRLIHGRVADALASDPRQRRDHRRLAPLARHLEAAGRETEAAAAYLEAGTAARAVFANREAVESLERSRALGHPDIGGIERAIGELRLLLGDYDGAIAALEAAASAATSDLPEIELLLGRVHARRGDALTAKSHLDAALAGADPAVSPLLRARVLVERSGAAHLAGSSAEARTDAREALELATAAGDRRGEGIARRLLGLLALSDGRLEDARAELTRSVDIALASGDPADAIAARNALAQVAARAGDDAGAISLLVDALDECHRIGDRHLEAAVRNNLADRLHAAGRADEAMAELKRAVVLFAEVGTRDRPEPGVWKLATW